MIELRSDTFSMPTDDMRHAMATADVGNDFYREDPTVRALEERAAELTGKQASCLMPSGTMANLAAMLAQAPRGSKVLVGSESDIYLYEAGGAAVCGGLMYEPITNQADGTLALSDIEAGFPSDPTDAQFALPSLICLENTQNRCGGAVLSLDYLEQVRSFANSHGVRVHLDGARVFNAAVALGVPAATITQYADSVQFCLSKGLGAPIGSMLAGNAELIERARRVRKMLGGGMRQAGVVAAAGLVALANLDRLAEDHRNALRLAEGLAACDGIEIDPAIVRTNIVLFRLSGGSLTWRGFVEAAAARGVAVNEFGYGRIRAVTYAGVDRAAVDKAVRIIRDVLVDADAARSCSA